MAKKQSSETKTVSLTLESGTKVTVSEDLARRLKSRTAKSSSDSSKS